MFVRYSASAVSVICIAARTSVMVCSARAAGPLGAISENILNLAGREAGAALLDWIQNLHQRVGGPAFAFDASDTRRTAALVDLGQRFRRGEDLVQVAHRALVGIAGIVAADARRIGDHGLQLLANHRLGIAQQDGVAVALRHLAAIGAGQLGRGREQDLGLGQHFAAVELVELVEAPRHFARQLHVRLLVLANGHILRLVEQNVRRHQHRIAEKSVGASGPCPSRFSCSPCSWARAPAIRAA